MRHTALEISVGIFVILLFLLGSCIGLFADKSTVIRAAETAGYTQIVVTDHSYLLVGLRGCDEKDTARFTVKAKNQLGKEVEFYVCTGAIFKGATIRTR